MIFCSNYTIEHCYTKADWLSIEALKLRVEEVDFGDCLLRIEWGDTPLVSPEVSDEE